MRTRYLSIDAVVLRSRAHGEADALVMLLAPVAGLLPAIAKNGLLSLRRFMGALATGTQVEALLARRQGAWYLEETVVANGYARMKSHAMTYAVGCYAIESVLASHPEGPAASDTFPLLVELLEHLDTAEADLPLTRLAWDLRFMEALGVAPQLADCIACGRVPEPARTFFDGATGGLLCSDHAAEQPGAVKVSPGAIQVMTELFDSALPSRGESRFRSGDRLLARQLTDRHMHWHLPLQLRSRRVLEQLSHSPPPGMAS